MDFQWIEEADWDEEEMARELKELQDPTGSAEQARDESMDNDTYWPSQLAMYRSRAKAVFRTFQSFVNVTYVDICWLE